MTRLDRFKRLWKSLEKATEQNDIDTINKTIEEIEKSLCFENDEEHQKWLDIVATFKDWDYFKKETFKIAQRRRNLKEDFNMLKEKITSENWIYKDVKSCLAHLCYDDSDIEKMVEALRKERYLRWW